MRTTTYDHIWNPERVHDGWLAEARRALRIRAYGVLSDESLVKRACAKDHAAFEALIARYRGRLHAMALASLGNDDSVSNAQCEMVLSAFHDIDSFSKRCSPGTWLYHHGVRAVFMRVSPPAGKYSIENRPAEPAASR